MEFYERLVNGPLRLLEPMAQEIFRVRLQTGMADILRPLKRLYGSRADFESWLYHFLHRLAVAYAERPFSLHLLDQQRQAEPDWFQQPQMLGYVCYTDRFAGNLEGVTAKIPYLKELGVTYLHLMPLLQPRPGANDGGYAVMDYCQIDPRLGSIDDLATLTAALRAEGISLCIDLVCNHTAKEHEWAQKAQRGDPIYQAYYLTFPDRALPDMYERTLREIFPDFAPGNFTFNEQMGRWVWTTFNKYQWDLNYKNPAVFAEMLATMLYLANQGVEVLRLDAVAFMWKRLGTDCENQPEAHYLLQAFRALSKVAAPALILKAEAIVPPRQLVPYLGQGKATNRECQIAYHNVLMVMLWSALAERKAVLMTHALQQMPAIPSHSSWATYVRCHDDIGWAVTEEDAAAVALDGFAHRAFLSDYYSGRFPGSTARGATFQFNPKTGDRRISGTLASLAGLEVALAAQDEMAVEMAIARILLLHSVIFTFGGLPLLYMGDEIGLLNDYGFAENPDHVTDNRWLHRPMMDWQQADERHQPDTVIGRIFQGVCRLIKARQQLPELHAQAGTSPVWLGNDHVLGLLRHSPQGRLLLLANVTESSQLVAQGRLAELGFSGTVIDALQGERPLSAWPYLHLLPYQTVWLKNESQPK